MLAKCIRQVNEPLAELVDLAVLSVRFSHEEHRSCLHWVEGVQRESAGVDSFAGGKTLRLKHSSRATAKVGNGPALASAGQSNLVVLNPELDKQLLEGRCELRPRCFGVHVSAFVA